MRHIKELTEEQKEWHCDNYGYMKRLDIAKELDVSRTTLSRLVKELGLTNRYRQKSKKNEVVKARAKHVQKAPTYEEGYDYCLYCSLYRVGGICEQNGKPTGALHKKSCFIANEECTNN